MADRAEQPAPSPWPVLEGGKTPLSSKHREAVSRLTEIVRELPPEQLETLINLGEELRKEDYLAKVRGFDVPVIKVLAEVISGWESDGVHEFARAWVSTLVSREDGLNWADCDVRQKQEHRQKVAAEMARRGIGFPD